MYNLLEYSKNCSKISGFLWNYYRDEPNNPSLNHPVGNNPPTINYNADAITKSASFKYKNSFIGKTPNNDNDDSNVIKDVGTVVPLKHLGNFWRTLDIPLINCEVSLTLNWSKNCVLTDMVTIAAIADPPVDEINVPTNATFKKTDIELYVPVVPLSSENDNKLLEQLKAGIKRTNKWNKYRSETSNQTKNNNLNYLIDPTFTKVNRMFVLSFKNETGRTSFEKYYVPKIEIKDFNVLIDGKPFFEITVKKIKNKHMKKLLK